MITCPIASQCGGCNYQGTEYERQLNIKQKEMEKLLGQFGNVEPIIGMENPCYYRNKVHHVFDFDLKGKLRTGFYMERSHKVVNVENCLLEDQKSQRVIESVKSLLKSFKISVFSEEMGTGWLRHVLVRRGFSSGEIMLVLVVTSPIFPGKNNFVKAILDLEPEITTIALNINDKDTTMVLGDRNITIYGPGFIKDELCGVHFRISPNSFYQVNPVQTEILYSKAMEFAGLCGKEKVIDAYCGIGTIGLIASKKAASVIGVELNGDAVRDAIINSKENDIKNARFYKDDAGKFMVNMAQHGETADVVFMDPPRSGSTTAFMNACIKLGPKKIVYVSCGPDTLARDLKYLSKSYKVEKIQPVDMFPFTKHCENVVLLERK